MYTLNDINLPSTIEAQEKYLAIVGFSKNGPVNTPFTIRDHANPYEILGECPVAEAYTAVKRLGVTPLLLRLNGSYASYVLQKNGIPMIRLTSVEAHDDCNNIRVQVYDTHIKIRGEKERAYLYSQYSTIHSLVEIINFDAKYGLGEVTAEALIDIAETKDMTIDPYEGFFSGGDDGSNWIPRLDGSDTPTFFGEQLDFLESMLLEGDSHTGELMAFNVDTVIVPDILFENAPGIAGVMGTYAESKSLEQSAFCSAVIGSLYFDQLESETYNYDEKIDILVDLGNKNRLETKYSHVEVILGVETGEEEEVKRPASWKYAAMRYFLEPHIPSTNKEIKEIMTLFSRFRKEDIALLTANGYTCIVPSIRRGHVAYKSTSFLGNQSLITSKPHYSRCTRHYTNVLIDSLDSGIGNPTNRMQVNIIDKAIQEKASELIKKEIFKSIVHDVRVTNYDEIKVSLVFLPYGEVESIQSSALYDPGRKTVITWA